MLCIIIISVLGILNLFLLATLYAASKVDKVFQEKIKLLEERNQIQNQLIDSLSETRAAFREKIKNDSVKLRQLELHQPHGRIFGTNSNPATQHAAEQYSNSGNKG